MMTNIAEVHSIPEPDVIGPYSEWPRRPARIWKKPAAVAGTVLVSGIYLHCGLPLLF